MMSKRKLEGRHLILNLHKAFKPPMGFVSLLTMKVCSCAIKMGMELRNLSTGSAKPVRLWV